MSACYLRADILFACGRVGNAPSPDIARGNPAPERGLPEQFPEEAHWSETTTPAKTVWAIRTRLQIASRTGDLALFNLAIDSKLRGCDVVSLKGEDVAPMAMPWTGQAHARAVHIRRK
jgi:hypothetical protein